MIQGFDHVGFWQSIISAMGALGLLKISIAFFLLRLSNDRWYARTLWVLIGQYTPLVDCSLVTLRRLLSV
jgi:hypothetical protein